MNQFRTIEELADFLCKDRDSVSLCPLRFINVDSLEMWANVKKLLISMSKRHVCLSSFCANEDTTPNMRRLAMCIVNSTDNICVSPLSEYLRLFPDSAQKNIEDLLARQYSGNMDGKLRIYIPMYRMRSILQNVQLDPRKVDCILFLLTEEESDYSLTVIQQDLEIKVAGNSISGFRQYLQYWEQNPDKPLILHTKNAIHFGRKVFFDNVRVIVSTYDLLVAHYNLPHYYSENDGVENDWMRLAKTVAREQSFESACCHELLINRYTPKLFEKWSNYDPFQRWLLWMWTRVEEQDGYLGACISSGKTVDAFVESIFTKIIDMIGHPKYEVYYSERKALIKRMQLLAPERFWLHLSTLTALDKLRVLTDTSEKERELIYKTLRDIHEDERTTAVKILMATYPALACYLQSAPVDAMEDLPNEFREYFEQYRWNKAANILPADFLERVQRIAEQKGDSVYALSARNLIVDEEYDDAAAIIFADGMGVEYADYLYASFARLQSEGYRVRVRIGFCNLPSTTEGNKDFLDKRRVAEELREPDEMKHGSSPYPKSIEGELRFLDGLREKVRNAFSLGVSRVILTTDHGTSRMAVLVRSTEFDKKVPSAGHVIYKYGRYCEGTDMADQLDTAIEANSKLIFADYQRFEQRGAPVDEIHGGATLEEWLVPVFIIDNTAARKQKMILKITAPSNQLRPDSMTKMVTVRFSFDEQVEEVVSVRIHGKKVGCRATNDQFEFKYKTAKGETTIVAKVYVGTEHVGEFKFFVKQGISQNNKFDLL